MGKITANSPKKTNDKFSQIYNPSTGHYIKRDLESGLIVDIKSDGKPFKGIKLIRSYIQANPSIKKSTAIKAEMAVIKVKNAKISGSGS